MSFRSGRSEREGRARDEQVTTRMRWLERERQVGLDGKKNVAVNHRGRPRGAATTRTASADSPLRHHRRRMIIEAFVERGREKEMVFRRATVRRVGALLREEKVFVSCRPFSASLSVPSFVRNARLASLDLFGARRLLGPLAVCQTRRTALCRRHQQNRSQSSCFSHSEVR